MLVVDIDKTLELGMLSGNRIVLRINIYFVLKYHEITQEMKCFFFNSVPLNWFRIQEWDRHSLKREWKTENKSIKSFLRNLKIL